MTHGEKFRLPAMGARSLRRSGATFCWADIEDGPRFDLIDDELLSLEWEIAG